MEVSGQLHPQGKSPWYPLDRGLGGPQSRSGRGGEEKNSQPPPGIEPQNADRPARSPALYRLSYHGSYGPWSSCRYSTYIKFPSDTKSDVSSPSTPISAIETCQFTSLSDSLFFQLTLSSHLQLRIKLVSVLGFSQPKVCVHFVFHHQWHMSCTRQVNRRSSVLLRFQKFYVRISTPEDGLC
jgi:hypothetical protein